MKWYDVLILIANVICLIGSIIGSIKSINYYKKSKSINNITNTKEAWNFVHDIFNILIEINKLCNTSFSRGKNIPFIVIEKFSLIKEKLTQIKGKLNSECSAKIDEIIGKNKNGYEIINEMISNPPIIEDKLQFNNDLNLFEGAMREVEKYLKSKIEEEAEILSK